MSGPDAAPATDSWRPLRRAEAPLGARIAVRLLAGLMRITVFVIDVWARRAPQRFLAPPPWPRPSGRYAVGVRDLMLERPPQGGEAAVRAARAWYPATPAHPAPTAPLLGAAEAQAARIGSAGTIPACVLEQMQAVRTAAVPRAAMLVPDGPGWPLLLFSHGLGGLAAQNTRLCEELASHGYVVVALSHETGAAATRQADGSYRPLPPSQQAKALDPWLYVCARQRRRARDRAARSEAARRFARIESLQGEQARWIAGIGAALDALAAGGHPFARGDRTGIDLGRIGLIGMSFGGSASAAAAAIDPRVRAAVNLDGGQVGAALYDRQIPVPLLVMQSGTGAPCDGGRNGDFYEPLACTGRSGAVFRLRIEGSGHLAYSDLALFGRGALRKLLGTAGVDGARMQAIVADAVLRFCERYVKGDASVAYPGELEARWPELRRIVSEPA